MTGPFKASVVIDDLDVEAVPLRPLEAKPPLIVDPDAVLTGAISLQRLQAISRDHGKRGKTVAAASISSFLRATLSIA
jgi:hypothetical protein